MLKDKYTVASLFCGAGGLDMGFEMTGRFKTIWANDCNKDATETMKLWCKEATILCRDITKVSSVLVPKADVMLGGFPCQPFSLGGKMYINDPRNKLYKEYVRILKRVQPYCFIGENVQGLAIMENGAVLDQLAKDFADVGYNIYYDLVDAVDYGVAQNRKRLVIVGYRKDLVGLKFPIPEKCEHKTMYDAIYGLPEPTGDEVHNGGFSSRYMSRNRVRGWNEASYTIVAGGRNMPLHPSSCPMIRIGDEKWGLGVGGKSRRFSYKECALLQSFPSDMQFVGDLESKYKQIGNAVPPLLGYAFAKEIAKQLDIII